MRNFIVIPFLVVICFTTQLQAKVLSGQDSIKKSAWPFTRYLIYTQVPMFDTVVCQLDFELGLRFRGNSSTIKSDILHGLNLNVRAKPCTKVDFDLSKNKMNVKYSFTLAEVERLFVKGEELYQYQVKAAKKISLSCMRPQHMAKTQKPVQYFGAKRSTIGSARMNGISFFKNRMFDAFRYMLPIEVEIVSIASNQKGTANLTVHNSAFQAKTITNAYIIHITHWRYDNVSIDLTYAHGKYKIKTIENLKTQSIEIKKKKGGAEIGPFAGKENELKCIVQPNTLF
jgi:hypothetical protein